MSSSVRGRVTSVDSTAAAEQGRLRLDIGCGDGFYTELLAERVGPGGRIVGMDVNAGFLDLAARRVPPQGAVSVEFKQVRLQDAPKVLSERFDIVWCAQCLYDFAEPVAAVRRMAQLVRPGGTVAVLENDTLHQLLLPWSMRLELALRVTERATLEEESVQPSKFYVGRRLPALLAEAGLEPLGFHTQTIDRVAPFDPIVQLFLKSYFAKLIDRVSGRLSPEDLAELREVACPEGNRYLLRDPYCTFTWVNMLAWGRRPVD
ncbi:MAG: class I SAM-dependent methyltransferase [Pirellulales bacterium]